MQGDDPQRTELIHKYHSTCIYLFQALNHLREESKGEFIMEMAIQLRLNPSPLN